MLTTKSSAHDRSDGLCPVCENGSSIFHAQVDGYAYFRCPACGSLHIDCKTLKAIDAGHSTRIYDGAYWDDELSAARQRATGASLARVGEAILYAQRPIKRFLDVGAGPGFLLDELAKCFPERASLFHAVELFPPEEHSTHPNYVIGDPSELPGHFDGGVCIEVVEHLTPRMLKKLAGSLAKISQPGSLWLFNTGMPEFVLEHDPAYLDPKRRGHVISYGLPGLEHIFAPLGFRISQVPGKNYAWIAEYQVGNDAPTIEVRSPLRENEALLKECGLLYQAAFESARASLYMELMLSRTRWALSLESELAAARHLLESRQTGHEDTECAISSQEELSRLKEVQAELQMQIEGLSSENRKILNSHSWKLMGPLRTVARIFRRER
jgi:hypothetical protein